MRDQWIDRLSEYVDGDLAASERAALEAHLAACAGCRTTLEELRRVVARAQTLDERPPAADLWPGIARQIGVARPVERGTRLRRRLSFTVPQLAAASVALALLSGGAAWLLVRQSVVAPPRVTADAAPPLLSAPASAADRRYATQVADLERALDSGRGRLDTTTVRVIEKNLAIIDRAIRDARSALAADPANAYLNLHLAQEMRRKLELLRQAATLAGART
ncbi:MAG TPA: zf-HC2 domain-containing protein [Gemmatimonadales bacterium]|nr:zf-HC2 domain-containing protein [Gemmatimonadales bacterium]